MLGKKKIVAYLMAFAMILSVAVPVNPQAMAATTTTPNIRLNKTELYLVVGQSYKMKVRGTTKKVTWKINKKKIATISKAGKVKAKKVGKATITATVSKKKYKCKLRVTAYATPIVTKEPVKVEPTVAPATPAPTAVPTPVPTDEHYATDVQIQNVSGQAIGTFNTYLTYIAIPDDKNATYGNCTSMQGMCMDVDGNKAYTIKISGSNDSAVIYCTDMNTRTSSLVTNADTGGTRFTSLCHANDMEIVTIGGEKYIYIVTKNDEDDDACQMEIYHFLDTTTVQKYKQCYINLKNESGQDVPLTVAGVALFDFDKDGNPILWFKKGKKIYIQNSMIENPDGTRTYNIVQQYVDNGQGLVSEIELADGKGYSAQGMCYGRGKLYIPFSEKVNDAASNRSIILVYDVKYNGSVIESVTKNSQIVMDITDSDQKLFEIESCAMDNNGRLYFNANRASSEDMIAFIENYNAEMPVVTPVPTATPVVSGPGVEGTATPEVSTMPGVTGAPQDTESTTVPTTPEPSTPPVTDSGNEDVSVSAKPEDVQKEETPVPTGSPEVEAVG